MKRIVKFSALFCSVLATLSLAAGLNQVAARLDPVSQKARAISAFEASQMPPEPCLPCVIDPP